MVCFSIEGNRVRRLGEYLAPAAAFDKACLWTIRTRHHLKVMVVKSVEYNKSDIQNNRCDSLTLLRRSMYYRWLGAGYFVHI